MYKPEKYTYCVFWSDEDDCFIGTVAEFPLLSHIDDTQEAALKGIVGVIDFVLKDMANNGEDYPKPFKWDSNPLKR